RETHPSKEVGFTRTSTEGPAKSFTPRARTSATTITLLGQSPKFAASKTLELLLPRRDLPCQVRLRVAHTLKHAQPPAFPPSASRPTPMMPAIHVRSRSPTPNGTPSSQPPSRT